MKEKNVFDEFDYKINSNIITNNGDYNDALFKYSYSIILMGVKKVEGV